MTFETVLMQVQELAEGRLADTAEPLDVCVEAATEDVVGGLNVGQIQRWLTGELSWLQDAIAAAQASHPMPFDEAVRYALAFEIAATVGLVMNFELGQAVGEVL